MTIGDESIGKWADVEMPSLVTVNLINTQKGADYWKSVGGIRGVRKLHILKPICSRDFLDLPIGDLEVLEELTFDLYDLNLADEEYFGQVYSAEDRFDRVRKSIQQHPTLKTWMTLPERKETGNYAWGKRREAAYIEECRAEIAFWESLEPRVVVLDPTGRFSRAPRPPEPDLSEDSDDIEDEDSDGLVLLVDDEF